MKPLGWQRAAWQRATRQKTLIFAATQRWRFKPLCRRPTRRGRSSRSSLSTRAGISQSPQTAASACVRRGAFCGGCARFCILAAIIIFATKRRSSYLPVYRRSLQQFGPPRLDRLEASPPATANSALNVARSTKRRTAASLRERSAAGGSSGGRSCSK